MLPLIVLLAAFAAENAPLMHQTAFLTPDGTLVDGRPYQTWTLDTPPSDRVVVTLATDRFQGGLMAWGPGGRAVTGTQSGDRVKLEIPAPEAGSWRFLVVGQEELEPHAYQLAVTTPDEARPPQACSKESPEWGAVTVGTRVRLGKHRPMSTGANWNDKMTEHVGKVGKVTERTGIDSSGCVVARTDADSGEWVWRIRDMVIED